LIFVVPPDPLLFFASFPSLSSFPARPKTHENGPQAQHHAAPGEHGHQRLSVPGEARADHGRAGPASAPSFFFSVDDALVVDCPFDRFFLRIFGLARAPPRALPGPDAASVVGHRSSSSCGRFFPFEGPGSAQGRGKGLLPLPFGEQSVFPLSPHPFVFLSTKKRKQRTTSLNLFLSPARCSLSPEPNLAAHQIVYDKIVNPGHWTVPMREAALEPARLKSGAAGEKIDTARLLVADVGGGTGFCTQGVVAAGVPPANVTLVDQVRVVVAGER
jgi:hypothetical protein